MSRMTAEAGWFVVHTKPRSEFLAAMSLVERGYRVFYPHVRGTRRFGRKFVGVLKPYFSRYVFVEIAAHQSTYVVNNTPGVSVVVYFAGRPLQVPDRIMAPLLAEADEKGLMPEHKPLEPAPRWVVGQKIEMSSGPLEGLLVEVAKVERGDRLRVWVDFLGGRRQIAVTAE
jgi:transcriptional antiterminator RfaH